jgi:very-short-patch-repair endonuclease
MRGSTLTSKRARTLRRNMSLPEVVLWDCLRARRLEGHRFRRQHPIGPYIVDFYCASARLAVEVDGASHDFQARVEHDRRRDAWLARQGVQVLRFSAEDILKDDRVEAVLHSIATACTGSSPAKRGGGPPKAVEGAAARRDASSNHPKRLVFTEKRERQDVVHATAPSTMLRMVPLPHLRWGRNRAQSPS